MPNEAEERPTAVEPGLATVNQGFIFGLGPAQDSLLDFHPPPQLIPVYWQLYKENCDTIIKVLHVPTTESLILQASQHLERVSKSLEVLLFAIYFVVVTSLSHEECLHILGGNKDNLLRTYKLSMEQALARASFLETEEMIVLQGFVIYLIALRIHCSIRLMWTLTALAVRLAQNAGIHRDGTHFNLSPFEVEMRRRLWWNICILDSRASEDSGYDAAIQHEGVDTRMPLNVNDSDLFPHMTEPPEPRVGVTEMIFSLVRFEATTVFRRLQYMSAGSIGECGKFHATKSLAEKGAWISKYREFAEDLFFKHANLSDPFSWYIAAICMIKLNKLWLVAHHPYLRRASCAGLPQESKDRLFLGSIQNIEYWLVLISDSRVRKWRWLCETYIQWYALAFLLSELCTRAEGALVERAWKAVNGALQFGFKLSSSSSQSKGAASGQRMALDEAHKPLSKLLQKARSARAGSIPLGQISPEIQFGENIASVSNIPPAFPTLGEEHLQPNETILNYNMLESHLSTSAEFLFTELPPEACQDLDLCDEMQYAHRPEFDSETPAWMDWHYLLDE